MLVRSVDDGEALGGLDIQQEIIGECVLHEDVPVIAPARAGTGRRAIRKFDVEFGSRCDRATEDERRLEGARRHLAAAAGIRRREGVDAERD